MGRRSSAGTNLGHEALVNETVTEVDVEAAEEVEASIAGRGE
jgi:hypothetical protein